MKLVYSFGASVVLLSLFLAGCGSAHNGTPTAAPNAHGAAHTEGGKQDEQRAMFAQLSVADRATAEAQGYCAVTSEPLGSMGPPLKLVINGQPIFVCCKGCEKKAKSNPDKTLANVAELKSKVKLEKTH